MNRKWNRNRKGKKNFFEKSDEMKERKGDKETSLY